MPRIREQSLHKRNGLIRFRTDRELNTREFSEYLKNWGVAWRYDWQSKYYEIEDSDAGRRAVWAYFENGRDLVVVPEQLRLW